MKHIGLLVDRFSRIPSINRINKERYAIFKPTHKETAQQRARFHSDERPMSMSDLESKGWAL